MVIADHHTVLEAESYIVAGKPRIWGDERENVEDKFVREFKN